MLDREILGCNFVEERPNPWYRYLCVVEVEENKPVIDHKGGLKIFGVFEQLMKLVGLVEW